MKRIALKPGEEGRIKGGHPWVYDNEAAHILDANGRDAALLPGEIADVESSRKEYLGRALVNPSSRIIARIYSPSKEGLDRGLFKRRIREALRRRAEAGFDLGRESERIIFAEADFLPGLIVDRFVGWPLEELEEAVTLRPLDFGSAAAALGPPRSWLSIQFLAYGMDSRREEILAALEETLAAPLGAGRDLIPGAPEGMVERSASKARELEGLPLRNGLLRGRASAGGIVIFENGFPFLLDLLEGQKTGHFLDQKDNRLRAAGFAAGGRVLDVCSYTGGFGIHAVRLGAAQALCVDSSPAALETARKNAALNGVAERLAVAEADVFGYLRGAQRNKERFDLVILDPPAFAKTRSALGDALRGYREINLRAMILLKPGGVLVSCSCSQALDDLRFRYMISGAAADAGRRLVMLDFRHQSADHPALVGYGESLYLKCGIYRAVG
jgi:23S rRNA (cytosine1962-C5)-methyltransferase